MFFWMYEWALWSEDWGAFLRVGLYRKTAGPCVHENTRCNPRRLSFSRNTEFLFRPHRSNGWIKLRPKIAPKQEPIAAAGEDGCVQRALAYELPAKAGAQTRPIQAWAELLKRAFRYP
jgi:hypothetical protein